MIDAPDMSGGRAAADDAFAPVKTDAFNEGMAVYLVDPGSGISFTLILYALDGDAGRDGQNRATVSVNLPGGLVAKSLDRGGARTATEFRSDHLIYEQVEPFRRWRYRFSGPVAVLPQPETLRRVIDDPSEGVLTFDLQANCVTPPWSPPSTVFASATPQAANEPPIFGFYVQNVRFEGTVEIAGRELNVRGTGWRHHVRARTWGAEIAGHHFIHVLFESGRAFGLQVAQLETGEATGFGYVYEDGVLTPGVVRYITSWNTLINSGERVDVVLECDGRTVKVVGETLNNVSVSTGRGGFGVDLADADSRFMTFADTRWLWDGEAGYGTWERSQRVSALKPPC